MTFTLVAPRTTRVGLPLLILATAIAAVPVLLAVGYPLVLVILVFLVLAALASWLLRSPKHRGFPSSEATELRAFMAHTVKR